MTSALDHQVAGVWNDEILYWQQSGATGVSKPPTTKRLEYAVIKYPEMKPSPVTMNICCGVYDDDKYIELNRDEIQWHADHGAQVTIPAKT